jgi:hypothetical protein
MSPAARLASTLDKDRTSFEEALHTRSLVAHTGFEPVISSLRGRCPGPLDECATLTDHSGLKSSFVTAAVTIIQQKYARQHRIQSRPGGLPGTISMWLDS